MFEIDLIVCIKLYLALKNLQRLICHKTLPTNKANIGSLKSAVQKEWNRISEEFILKAGKSFPRRVDTIIEKDGGYIEYIYFSF